MYLSLEEPKGPTWGERKVHCLGSPGDHRCNSSIPAHRFPLAGCLNDYEQRSKFVRLSEKRTLLTSGGSFSGELRFARLPATVTGSSYELTADIIEPAQANFIGRKGFLHFLKENGEAALRVTQQLGETYHSAISEMRTIGLSHSASEKLARFLLGWAANCPEEKGQVRIKMTLTHEEIAQMIGSSRERVTRLLAEFRRKQLLQIAGSTLILRSKTDLEAIINGQAFSCNAIA
jgi:CRP-like cAMP-binding protein